MFDLKDKTFSIDEYKTLRSEQNVRIEIINDHSFKINNFVMVFYAAVIAILGVCFDFIGNENTIFGRYIVIEFIISLILTVFTSIPIFMLYTFSGKYNDNLRQIVSISTYQKIFFELPSLKAKGQNILGWEFFHDHPEVPKAKLFAKEYTILSITAIFCTALVSICLSASGFFLNKYFKDGYNNPNLAAVIVFYVLLLGYIGYMIILAIKITRNTDSEKLIGEFVQEQTNYYLEIAKKSNYLTEQERAEFKKLLNGKKSDGDIAKADDE